MFLFLQQQCSEAAFNAILVQQTKKTLTIGYHKQASDPEVEANLCQEIYPG